jgi:D-inositol-3-phosphate glycosyltransferase
LYDIAKRVANSGAFGPVVLFVGHAGLPNGFSRVLHSLLRELPKPYRIHHFGINLSEDQSDTPALGWHLHHNPGRLHSPDALRSVIEEVRPHIVVVLDEPWVCSRLAPVLSGERAFRTVFYGAVDSDDAVTYTVARDLAQLDCFVAFTRFGLNAVASAFRNVQPQKPRPILEIIPHGVDRGIFRPLAGGPEDNFCSSRRQSREILFRDRPGLRDAFIVLNANRNQPFKRIDLCVEGFARFAQGKPANVKLYLHMASRPPSPSAPPLVDALGIRDRLLCTSNGEHHPEIPSSHLNLIYAASDVGINTSEKEGWGLISFEHAASGGAQIVPRHSACAELWSGNAAVYVDPVQETNRQACQVAGRTVTVESVAQALETLYAQTHLRSEIARVGYHNATKPEYSWQSIAASWDALFQKLLSGSKQT